MAWRSRILCLQGPQSSVRPTASWHSTSSTTARQVVLVLPMWADTQHLLLTSLRHLHFQKYRPIGMIPQMTLLSLVITLVIMPDSILSPEWKAADPGLCSFKSSSCQRSDIPDGSQEIVLDKSTSCHALFSGKPVWTSPRIFSTEGCPWPSTFFTGNTKHL